MKTRSYATLILILLFTQKVRRADGDCLYDKHIRQCSCSLLDLNDIMTIMPCLPARSFEFNGGIFIDAQEFDERTIKSLMDMLNVSLTKISLVNLVLSEKYLAAFINVISQVPVELLSFENTTFVGQSPGLDLKKSAPRIPSLQFINTSSNPLIQKDSVFDSFGNWMSILRNLTVKESQLSGVPCDNSLRFQSLSNLELSGNLLTDDTVSSIFCDGAFPNLHTLKLRSNNFSNFETVCQVVSRYNQLQHLDLSLNEFSAISNSLCEWQPSLSHLNLSSTGLEQVIISLPLNCEVLDLSHNRIEYLNISLPRLRELYVSYNRFSTLNSIGHIPYLQVLAIDGNPMKLLEVSQIQTFEHLRSFKGDNVPYTCSCSFIKKMKEMVNSNLTVQGWPEGYTCDSPESFRGKMISDVNHSLFECHTQLFTAIICVIILLLCVSIIICFVKICRSNKTRSQCMETGNSNSA
ncbi:monocyte differentiation antigen CD14 [Leptodactylus fuscus]|uniref:monocyte differentiation antigen CD14 n=1 Tax=Leptodactylus fuscus TaxID=238119 RepID=UPI003F4E458D